MSDYNPSAFANFAGATFNGLDRALDSANRRLRGRPYDEVRATLAAELEAALPGLVADEQVDSFAQMIATDTYGD